MSVRMSENSSESARVGVRSRASTLSGEKRRGTPP
jgi:hypothetical protein